ncbi:MAG: CBS domain-containing protein [Deltaproteobacteria bacterium]|nr:CBS domain-containing protein [Deltaproteobacteria bacterium]MBW1738399.1 CBS domain-containing protein [Deltaproteobacteria bacterium]MBW1909706.1 CBS domain-containing protein [Deltaproteobacteria bacterium]MBW2034579.1 CBS domain-containing protein [Deltaproteobacteria bacterium]MBW2115357.1 CBS domain-containing protein [Deltaproteobacteria bacterium]
MIVRNFMRKEVITVDFNTPIMAALEIMKQNKIKRLPVTKNAKFVGLITRAMIRDASPSEATSLSIYEINYLISKMIVGKLMVKKPVTISPDLPVEEAIRLGKKHGIGGFPVIENGELVGIITESDIIGVVSNALGLGEKDSKRITIDATGKRFGYLKDLVEVLDSNNIPILSLMSVPKSKKGDWSLILRLKTRHAAAAKKELAKKGFKIT